MRMRSFVTSLFRKPYRTIDVTAGKALLADGATLIDVRSILEWPSGHAPQAKHAPLDRLATSTVGIRDDRPVVVMCHSGARSASAARLLTDRGFEAYSLRGGITAWRQAGEPIRYSLPPPNATE